MEKNTKNLLIILAVLLVAAGGFWGYKLFFKKKPAPPKVVIKVGGSKKSKAAVNRGNAPVAQDKTAAAPLKPNAASGIKVTEEGKVVEYKTPEELVAKSKLPLSDLLAFSQKNLDDTKKNLESAQAGKDKKAIEVAKGDFATAQKLLALLEKKRQADRSQKAIAYSSLGKRDPFMNPLEIPKVYPPVPANAKPLERVAVETIKVKAIMWNNKGLRAMVTTADGRGYTVREGDRLGDKRGKITKITKDKVIITEHLKDILDNVEIKRTVLELYQ